MKTLILAVAVPIVVTVCSLVAAEYGYVFLFTAALSAAVSALGSALLLTREFAFESWLHRLCQVVFYPVLIIGMGSVALMYFLGPVPAVTSSEPKPAANVKSSPRPAKSTKAKDRKATKKKKRPSISS